MAVPPCAEGPGEARGRPYGQEPQVQRRERLVAVAQRRERRRRLLHLPSCTGTRYPVPCTPQAREQGLLPPSLVIEGDGDHSADAPRADRCRNTRSWNGSGGHAYKEAGLRFLFYHKISRLSDGCTYWVWHLQGGGLEEEYVRGAPPFFLTRSVRGV